MLRYRIERDESGRNYVLPALSWLVPPDKTYATRTAAQAAADTFNRQREGVQGLARNTANGRLVLVEAPDPGASRMGESPVAIGTGFRK